MLKKKRKVTRIQKLELECQNIKKRQYSLEQVNNFKMRSIWLLRSFNSSESSKLFKPLYFDTI